MGEDFYNLNIKNWEDGDPRKDVFDIDVDREIYQKMEDLGTVVLVTARDGDGTLAGYINFFIHEHPHSKGLIQAASDALYVDKEYRGMGVFKDMLKASEELLRESYEVSYISITLREGATKLEGYDKSEVVFSKIMKEKL